MSTELQAQIRKIVADENVKHIQLWFTDILGNLKMVEVPDRQLDSVLESGAAFDGSSISGYAEIEESDIVAMPDWSTFKVLPWAQGSERTAFVFCDVLDRNYKPFEGDPRWVLRRQLERAKKHGPRLLRRPRARVLLLQGAPRRPSSPTRAATSTCCPPTSATTCASRPCARSTGSASPWRPSHHEVAPSQHEIDPHYDEALVMADRVMITRLIVKEVAAHNGVHATFMPKPLHGENGSGMHVHQSLFRGKYNAFFSDDRPRSPERHRQGLHRRAAARTCASSRSLLNQYVNSYKRLVPGYEAPVYISWAHRNRTALIRVPLYVQGKESTVRAELRNPDPAANPYLAFAVMLGRRPRRHREGLRAARRASSPTSTR